MFRVAFRGLRRPRRSAAIEAGSLFNFQLVAPTSSSILTGPHAWLEGARLTQQRKSVKGKRNGSISQIPAKTDSTREAAHERRRPAPADFAQRCQGVSGLPPVRAPRTVNGSAMIVHASQAFDLDVLRRD